MKKILSAVVLAACVLTVPAFAKDKKKDAPAEAPASAPATPSPLSKEELAQRSLKGVQNQTAWVATLEKQLADEKAKLAKMESEHSQTYGELPKTAEKS